MKQLTPAQQLIFDYIVAFKTEHDGTSPSVREILDGVGYISSTSTINHHLEKLREKGWIKVEKVKGQYRHLQIVGGSWSYHPQSGLTNTGD